MIHGQRATWTERLGKLAPPTNTAKSSTGAPAERGAGLPDCSVLQDEDAKLMTDLLFEVIVITCCRLRGGTALVPGYSKENKYDDDQHAAGGDAVWNGDEIENPQKKCER